MAIHRATIVERHKRVEIVALARGKCVAAGELKHLLRIGRVAPIAQIGKRLPQERIEFERPSIRLGRHFVAFRLRAHLGNELQRKAGDLAEFGAYRVQVAGFGKVLIV